MPFLGFRANDPMTSSSLLLSSTLTAHKKTNNKCFCSKNLVFLLGRLAQKFLIQIRCYLNDVIAINWQLNALYLATTTMRNKLVSIMRTWHVTTL